MISLAQLAEAATGTASRVAGPTYYSVSVEEARASVKVKDGNRKPNEGGSQKLTVVLGKHTLPLDCIKAGTTRVAVTADQVVDYTAALEAAVVDGLFDDAIAKAQELGKAAAEKAAANPRTRAPKVEVAVEETAGLDLDELDELEG